MHKYYLKGMNLQLVASIFGFAMMMMIQAACSIAVFRFQDLYIDGTLTRQSGYCEFIGGKQLGGIISNDKGEDSRYYF